MPKTKLPGKQAKGKSSLTSFFKPEDGEAGVWLRIVLWLNRLKKLSPNLGNIPKILGISDRAG